MIYNKLDKTVITYLDDILVYTKGTKEKYLKKTRQILKRLKNKEFQINKEKTYIRVQKVEFLESIITLKGI